MKLKEKEDIYPIMEEFFDALYSISNPVFRYTLNPTVKKISKFLLLEVGNFKTNLEKEQFRLFFDRYEFFINFNINLNNLKLSSSEDIKIIKTNFEKINETLNANSSVSLNFSNFFESFVDLIKTLKSNSKKIGFEKFHQKNSKIFIAAIRVFKKEWDNINFNLEIKRNDMIISGLELGGNESDLFNSLHFLS